MTVETVSDIVAARVREVRKRRGWQPVDLALRCAELGAGAGRLTENVIENIESGRRDKDGRRRRDVTVDELLVLACALSVAPVYLLVGLDDDAPYPVTAALTGRAELVRQWVYGLYPLEGIDRQQYYSYAPERVLAHNAELARLEAVSPELFQRITEQEGGS